MIGSDIITSLALRKRDISDVDAATRIQWLDYINKFAYKILIGTDPERLMSTQNYTVTTSPSSQALPADFSTIGTGGAGFYYVDSNSVQSSARLVRTGTGRQSVGYWISGTNVVFTGINATQALILRYVPAVTAITAVSDTMAIPDEFEQYALNAIDVLYDVWDEDLGAENFADLRFVRSLDEFVRNVRKEPGAESLPDFSLMY
jgi:hypothetical protein